MITFQKPLGITPRRSGLVKSLKIFLLSLALRQVQEIRSWKRLTQYFLGEILRLHDYHVGSTLWSSTI